MFFFNINEQHHNRQIFLLLFMVCFVYLHLWENRGKFSGYFFLFIFSFDTISRQTKCITVTQNQQLQNKCSTKNIKHLNVPRDKSALLPLTKLELNQMAWLVLFAVQCCSQSAKANKKKTTKINWVRWPSTHRQNFIMKKIR